MPARQWSLLLGLGLLAGASLVVAAALRWEPESRGLQPGDTSGVSHAIAAKAGGDVKSDFSQYAVLSRSNIFGERGQGSDQGRPHPEPVKALPEFPQSLLASPPGSGPASRSAAADPLSGWSYSGYMLVDGEKIAVIENRQTGEGHFLRKGESLRQATVSEITEEEVRFARGGKTRALAVTRQGPSPTPALRPAAQETASSGAPGEASPTPSSPDETP